MTFNKHDIVVCPHVHWYIIREDKRHLHWMVIHTTDGTNIGQIHKIHKKQHYIFEKLSHADYEKRFGTNLNKILAKAL